MNAFSRTDRLTSERLFRLKLELSELDRQERTLENHVKCLKQVRALQTVSRYRASTCAALQSIKNIADHPVNRPLMYNRHTDIGRLYRRNTVLVVRGPFGMNFDAGTPVRVAVYDWSPCQVVLYSLPPRRMTLPPGASPTR